MYSPRESLDRRAGSKRIPSNDGVDELIRRDIKYERKKQISNVDQSGAIPSLPPAFFVLRQTEGKLARQVGGKILLATNRINHTSCSRAERNQKMPAQLEGVKGKNKKKELKISSMGEVTKKKGRKFARSRRGSQDVWKDACSCCCGLSVGT